jgi:predicted ArsR family transcriptional regulator
VSGSGLNPTEFSSAVTAISAAFGDPTRRSIYLYVREHDGVTASAVAEQFALHANVARHHLDKLAAGGYLEVQVGGGARTGAGRPSKRYLVSEGHDELGIPVRQDDLMIMLLGRALSLLPPDDAEVMAEQVGAEFGQLLAASLDPAEDHHRSLQASIHAVVDALTAHGFAAHSERTNNELRIVSDHCPFGDAPRENPVICSVDRGLVRGMLSALYGDTATELVASRVLGDDVCATAVDA